ncbi:HAD family hydrolase [Streptomyces sp. NBC_01465]|uniref:HAD family hydrolase n=1 Tax=Streptomyces sp. NBC_01465 TaxID=2903878 RepID=UPI002E2F4B1F|nr:HAD family phosphatase [Streptomyces sp. NBC_01465]
MTGTVLFDLFGVIARQQSEEGKDRLVKTAGVPAPAFWGAYWAYRPRYDSGQLTGATYWEHVLGTLPDATRTAALIEADIASWSAVDDEMVDLISELAASGRRIALLSNIPEELAVHYEAHHPWLKHFEFRAFSCRIGHAKPDPDAYLWCRKALGEDPARVLFVDDRRENIVAAEATGLRGHLFTGIAPLREALSAAP